MTSLAPLTSTAFIQSKRLSAITNRCSRQPEDIGDLDERVLHVGRDDPDVVRVEGDEFEFFHGRVPFPAILVSFPS